MDVQSERNLSVPDQIGTKPGTRAVDRRHSTTTDERNPVAPSIHQQIRTAVANMANRPVPARWVAAEPTLAAHSSPAGLVAAVRRDPSSQASDDALRALLRLARHDTDAATVVLDALLPTMSRCIGRTAHPMFYEDVLTELALVILEVDDQRSDQVAKRLAKKAVRRSLRRVEIENRHRDSRLGLDEGFDSPTNGASVEDQALQRTELTEVARRVAQAIEAGRMTPGAWTAFLDGKVIPAVTGERLPVDRRTTFSATQIVRRQLDHAC